MTGTTRIKETGDASERYPGLEPGRLALPLRRTSASDAHGADPAIMSRLTRVLRPGAALQLLVSSTVRDRGSVRSAQLAACTDRELHMMPSDRDMPPPLVQYPPSLHELAPGLALARGGPGRTLNVYLLGTVVVDSGVRWSRRLARQLAGRPVTAHVLTHAHFDHAGSSAWLCRGLGVPLWCGAGDTAAITSGRVDSHGSPLVNRLQRTLAPVSAHPVSRALEEGDLVGGFEVLEVPGHSPGALAFWRERDRVLVCGDVLANLGLHPRRPRLVLAPAALSSDYEQNRRSACRLAELRPRLACFGHGFALTDPGRFATAIQQLGPAPS